MVTFSTHSFPNVAMRTIDVFISNHVGDDAGIAYDVLSWRSVSMPLRFPGEPYGARVSSLYGSFPNVQLRFFAQPEVRVVHFANSTSPVQTGAGITRGRTHTTPTFVSQTGLVQIQFSYVGVNNPPIPYTIQLQRQQPNGTWTTIETINKSGWAVIRRFTFTRNVGVGAPVRVVFSTNSTGFVRTGDGTIRDVNQLSPNEYLVHWMPW
jgi:hypothetical protein